MVSLVAALREVGGQLTGGLTDAGNLTRAIVATMEAERESAAGVEGRVTLYGWHHHSARVEAVVEARCGGDENASRRAVVAIEGARLLDSLAAKVSALTCAVDAASSLCRISGALREV